MGKFTVHKSWQKSDALTFVTEGANKQVQRNASVHYDER
jgi:hypothetical protein